LAHHNTVFAQLLKYIPRHEFETLANQHHIGRRFRTASRWSQFVAMPLAQLSGRTSLRDIVANLSVQAHRLYPWTVPYSHDRTSRASTSTNPMTFTRPLFEKLLTRCQAMAPRHGFHFRNKLYSLDASTVDLCLSVFPWANFRTTKGAIKLHVGLDHESYLPESVILIDGKTTDITTGRARAFPSGSIVACDRGYNDYGWFKQLTEKGIFFVTRLKKNAQYRIVARRTVSSNQGLRSDQTIEFTGLQARKHCPMPLRRIGYRDPLTGKHYVFLTNHFALSAKTIADIYKQRWQIELFFKWIKQNLKIKTFIGTSKNAVMTQIWIALCVYLLLAFIKFQSTLDKSMRQILQLSQIDLFDKHDLYTLLRRDPTDNKMVNPNQLAFH